MNKFIKLTISAVVALLIVGVVSSTALEAREPKALVARTKGLPPLEARTKGLPPPPLVARTKGLPPPPLEARTKGLPPPPLVARTKGLPPPPLVARTKGLPPDVFVARQDVPSIPSLSDLPLPTTYPTDVPKVSPAVAPTDPVDTVLTTPGPAPTRSGAHPSGTGTLIAPWSSLVAGAGGTVPPYQPTSAPPYPAGTSTGETPAATVPSAAHKIENSLISSIIIAGIASLFL